MFKKISYILLGMTLMVSGTVLAAPYFTFQRTLLPETNNAFDLGTTTSVWRDLFVTQICLSGDCKTAWPAGGPGSSDGYGFTPTTYNGVAVQSTTTGLWLKATSPYSLIASTSIFTNATSTSFGVNNFYAGSSAGLNLHSNNGTDIAIFGAGGGPNATFYGGVNIDGATRLATSLTGLLKASSGTVSTAVSGTDIKTINGNSILGSGDLTVTGASGLGTSSPWNIGEVAYVVAPGTVSSTGTTSVTCSGTVSCSTFNVLGSGPITITGSGGSGSGNVSTSTNETSGRLAYWTTMSGTPAKLGDVSTSTLTLSGFPANIPSTLGNLVGGSNTTWTWWGLATTSQPSSSNILVSNGGQGVYGVATSTLTATSPLTGSFVQIGTGGSLGCQTASSAQAGCLSASKFSQFDSATTTAGTGLTYSGNAFNVNTTQNITNLSGLTTNGGVYTTGGNGTLNAVATSTATVSTGLSYSGTMGSMFGGTSGNLTLNMANANSWTALQTFANSSTTLGSFTYASTTELRVGTGQGIAYVGSNGKLGTTATSTFSLSQFTNDLANLTALDTTLTFSGSYNGSVARTIGLNLGNANTWTALQTFGNSTTTYGSFTNASTTNLFVGTGQGLLYTGSAQAVKAVSTSTPTVTAPITYSGTLGSFVGGVAGAFDCTTANASTKGCITGADFSKFNSATTTFSWPLIYTGSTNAVTWGGISTSTSPTIGQLPMWTGVNTLGSTATTTVTCSGSVSCSQFNILGSSPITITGSGGTSAFEIATTSTISVPQLAYFTQTSGRTTLGGVSTTTATCGGVVTCTSFSILGSTPVTISSAVSGSTYWATSSPYTGSIVQYPIDTTSDIVFGRNSTTSAPFWWDVSATSTYIGNGGMGTSSMSFSGGTGTNKFWNLGSYSTSQNGNGNFFIASSSSDTDMVTNQYFTISQSGLTGISTSTPWGLLSVNPDALGSGVPEFVVGSSSATHLIIDGSGDVGIGTTSPGQKLTVEGSETAYQGVLAVRNTASQGYVTVFNAFAPNITSGQYAQFRVGRGSSANNSAEFNFKYNSTNSLFSLGMYGNPNILNYTYAGRVGISSTTPWAKLSVDVDGIGSGVPMFAIGSSTQTRFIIDYSGDVGIGTTSPMAILTVGTSTSPTGTVLPLFALASTSSGGNPPVFMITRDAHITTAGLKPTLTTCGTSPSITGNDTAGIITMGTAAPTRCTITFANTFTTAPACTVSVGAPASANGHIGMFTSSSTATTLSIMSKATTTGNTWVGMTSFVAAYHCIGTQ